MRTADKKLPSYDLRWTLIFLFLAFAVHAGLGGFFNRDFIDHDDSIFVTPLFGLTLQDYFSTWLPQRVNEAFPVRDLTFFLDHWLSEYLGFKTFWLTNFILFGAYILVFSRWLLKILPEYKARLFILAMAIFHPINIEILQWASMRKNILIALFVSLALLIYSAKRKFHRVWFFLFYLLSLGCYPTAVLLPLWLIYKEWPQRTRITNFIWLGIFLVFVGVYWSATSHSGMSAFSLSAPFESLVSSSEKALIFILAGMGRGFFNLVFPYWLAPFYNYQSVLGWLGLGLIILLTVWLFKVLRKNPFERTPAKTYFFLGACLLFPSLITLLTFPDFNWADRYAFLPLPFFLLAALATNVSFRRVSTAIWVIWFGLAAFKTVQRIPLWKDDLALIGDCARHEKSPKCLLQIVQRKFFKQGCDDEFLQMAANRRKSGPIPFERQFNLEVPFFHGACIALDAKKKPQEKLEKLPYLFDDYEGSAEVIFSLVLAHLEAKDLQGALNRAQSYYLDGSGAMLSLTNPLYNFYLGQGLALCKLAADPACLRRLERYEQAHRFGRDPGRKNWAYQLTLKMYQTGLN